MTAAPPNFFHPERLDGEGFKTYRHRLKTGALASGQGRLIAGHKPSKAKLARRALVAAVGIRQAKKLTRRAMAHLRGMKLPPVEAAV